ncbi:MAG: NuoM family protein [Phycisphaerales bacterium JB050]
MGVLAVILWSLILVPALASIVIAMRTDKDARLIAMVSSLLCGVLTLVAASQFDWSNSAAMQLGTESGIPLIPALGVSFSTGVDAIALWLIILAAFLQPLMIWGSSTAITANQRAYYGWLTALFPAMVGVFIARDLIFFYACFELTLVPMYVLISSFGSTNRKKAATKFFLYTFTGSIIALAGLVYVAVFNLNLDPATFTGAGEWNFDIAVLQQAAHEMSLSQQAMVLFAMMAGFAVKVPLFPVHTWLPLAHTEAPTAGSVILAGVLLKLGTYAILRFVVPFAPEAVVEWAWLIAIFAIVGIVYAGLICWVQRDVKKLVAYSSVSHLGFCVLGLFALNMAGLQGSVLYMINHGLSTGALFFCIGMMYERYHTRSFNDLGGLARKMPVWAFFMGFFTMASVGLPGLNGFVSEFLCLIGTFQSGASGVGGTFGPLGPWFAAFAGTGMIVAAIYLLFMMGKLVFGPLREPDGYQHHGPLPEDLSRREIGICTILAVPCLVLGLYPSLITESLEAPLQQTIDIYTAPTPEFAGNEPVDAVALLEEVAR